MYGSESFGWMQLNITSQQVARILRVQEQMVVTKVLEKMRGKKVENVLCILCKKKEEGVKHWLNNCEYLAGREYLKRHDQSLRVLYAEVLKKFKMEEESVAWFNIKVEPVRESDKALVVWNMRIPTHTKVAHRWPDLRVESNLDSRYGVPKR